jgi:hypothetical protein
MAFNQSKLTRSVEQSNGIFNKYVYETDDAMAEIQSDGYFIASRFARYDSDDTNSMGWHHGIIEAQCSNGYLIGLIDGDTGSLSPLIQNTAQSIIYVREANDLAPPLRSDKVYVIDGIVDMGSQSVEVPQTGLSLRGTSFDISGLISSEDNYTMFTTPLGGSGNVLGFDYFVTTNGTGSKVYDIKSATGNEAFEFSRVNYINCTSLGVIDNYRQGLEQGTGRFGGEPELTLAGSWIGGYRITTSITAGIPDGSTISLFKAGAGFSMNNRFLTDMNVDLGSTASFMDFSGSNFTNPSILQIRGAIISRNGVFDADDPTIMPNITASNLVSSWRENLGLPNTHVGGTSAISTESTTTISSSGVFVDLEGATTASELEHFDQPSDGQIRHLGVDPRDYLFTCDYIVEGPQNNQLTLKLVKWDDSTSTFIDVVQQTRQVNALSGPRDVAIFNINTPVKLDQGDYVKLQIANNSGTGNVTAELASFYVVSER